MKKAFTFIAIACIAIASHAQNLSLTWAKSLGGPQGDEGNAIAVDASGNVYTTGYFTGTADFDPDSGTYDLTTSGDSNIFVSKLDPNGNFVWAKQFAGSNQAEGKAIKVDASKNVYIAGVFQGTVNFNPNGGTYNLTSAGFDDIFISKLDSNGNFIWAKRMGGPDYDEGNAIAIDASGNVYTAGYFFETADFDPGPGIYNLVDTNSNNPNAFISKLDANGNFVWAKQFGGTGQSLIEGMALDNAGNVYTTGYFIGKTDFDPGAGTYYYNTGIYIGEGFVSKLNNAGNFVWAKEFVGSDNGNSWANAIALDGSANVYTTGSFGATVDFDPDTSTYNITSPEGSVYVSKLDSSGKFIMAKALMGSNDVEPFAIALDANNNIYTTGYFTYYLNANPGPGSDTLTAYQLSYPDIFISRLDASGNFVWGKSFGLGGFDDGFGITVDDSGYVYTTGDFEGNVNFDPAGGTYDLTNAGYRDVFITKMSQSDFTTGVATISSDNSLILYPNPGSGEFTIGLAVNARLVITDILGREVFNRNLEAGKSVIQLKNESNGLYIAKALFQNSQITKKIVIDK